jgi:mRNA interferase MazF
LGVVVQADPLLQGSTVIIAPTSTQAARTSWRPEITVKSQPTLVMTDQLVAVDTGRLGDWVATLPLRDLDAVDDAIKRMLGLR